MRKICVWGLTDLIISRKHMAIFHGWVGIRTTCWSGPILIVWEIGDYTDREPQKGCIDKAVFYQISLYRLFIADLYRSRHSYRNILIYMFVSEVPFSAMCEFVHFDCSHCSYSLQQRFKINFEYIVHHRRNSNAIIINNLAIYSRFFYFTQSFNTYSRTYVEFLLQVSRGKRHSYRNIIDVHVQI